MCIIKIDPTTSRREFLKFLAASPLLAASGFPKDLLAQSAADVDIDQHLIKAVDEAINVFDFESVAKAKLPPAHWGYIASGVEDNATLKANRAAFKKYHLRPRRLNDVSQINMKRNLFGTEWESPIFLCPVASQKAFYPEGEIAVARAAKKEKQLQILSTAGTSSVEDVNKARGAPIWYQLYTYGRDITQSMVRRAEAAGSPVLVLTVDQHLPGQNRETRFRYERKDTRNCFECHDPENRLKNRPMFDHVNLDTYDG